MILGRTVSGEPPSLEQHPDIKHVRKYSLIFIGIDLVLWLINFLFIIHSYAASDSLDSQKPNNSSQLLLIIISLIYYGYGLLVSHRYYQTGLLFLALLGLVLLVLTCAILITLLIRIIHTANHMGFVAAGIIVAIIYLVICFLSFILQTIIIIYSFKFYRLLKANIHLTIEQV